MKSSFRLLDAARSVTDDILELLDSSSKRFIHEGQIRDAVGSIPYNIREGYGREGNDRKQFLRVARASAEETDEQLRTNYVAKRLDEKRHWQLHNRLVVIRKMIDAILGE